MVGIALINARQLICYSERDRSIGNPTGVPLTSTDWVERVAERRAAVTVKPTSQHSHSRSGWSLPIAVGDVSEHRSERPFEMPWGRLSLQPPAKLAT